jgi:hypothetical protein
VDLKTALVDTLDPRPLPKVTLYALGTLLEGIAVGLVLTVLFPGMSTVVRCVGAGVCFLLGAVFAVSAYSALKRRYKIVERTAEPGATAARPRD